MMVARGFPETVLVECRAGDPGMGNIIASISKGNGRHGHYHWQLSQEFDHIKVKGHVKSDDIGKYKGDCYNRNINSQYQPL